MSGNNTGTASTEWAWETRYSSGYSYPRDTHLQPRNTVHRASRNKNKWPPHGRHRRLRWPHIRSAMGATSIAILSCLGLAMLTAPSTGPAAPTAAVSVTTTALGAARSPYRDAGDWRIGTSNHDIPPGAYLVTVTHPQGGYWARCADRSCQLGAGMLDNRWLPVTAGTTLLYIEATDYMVKTSGVALSPA